MHRAVGQLPDQPRIDVAEQQLAIPRLAPRVRNILQNPANLAPGKIRIDHQPGLFA